MNIVQDSSEMSLEDVQNYFNWFMAIKDERLSIFYQHVFNSAQVELSKNKLQAVYYFFKDNLAVKKRTSEEIELERSKLPEHLRKMHKVPDYAFIEPTYSIIFDAGIYFGEILRKEIPPLKWDIEKDQTMVNYGKPVLIKEGINSDLHPSGLFHILAIQIQNNTDKEDRLLNLFTTWKDSFLGKEKDYSALMEKLSKGKR